MTQLKIRQEPEGMTIELPRSGSLWRALVPVLLFIPFLAFFIAPLALTIGGDNTMPFEMKLLVSGVLGFFFGLLPLLLVSFKLIRELTFRVRVVVDGRRLRVEEHYSGRKKAVEIPADELEELTLADSGTTIAESEAMRRMGQSQPGAAQNRFVADLLMKIVRYGKPSGITARSDRVTVTFGANLSPEDQAYLFALVRQAVAG